MQFNDDRELNLFLFLQSLIKTLDQIVDRRIIQRTNQNTRMINAINRVCNFQAKRHHEF